MYAMIGIDIGLAGFLAYLLWQNGWRPGQRELACVVALIAGMMVGNGLYQIVSR